MHIPVTSTPSVLAPAPMVQAIHDTKAPMIAVR